MKPNPWRQVCPTPPPNPQQWPPATHRASNWMGFDPNNELPTRRDPGYSSTLPSRSTVRKMSLSQVKLLPIETRAALAERDYKDGRRILLGVVAVTVLLGLAWLVLAFSAESTAVRLDVIEGGQK